jgi:hypothetical protein
MGVGYAMDRWSSGQSLNLAGAYPLADEHTLPRFADKVKPYLEPRGML